MPIPLINGVMQVCGEHDVGKTTFALECGASPDRILFLDDDLKGRATVNDLVGAGIKFGRYVDLVELSEKKAEYEFHQAVMKMIREIKPGEFDAIVWDTWTNFANTTHAYVLRHPDEFKKEWAPLGTIKGAQQWQEARRYEAIIISYLAKLAPSVILITHLKDAYVGKVKVPGKQVPASSSALDRVMRFRIWLRLNPNGRPVPIGLVMKRLDKKYANDGMIRTINVLPRKLSPSDEEHSLWDTIRYYWENPMGDREPEEPEMPDEYELSVLDGTLTREQLRTMQLLIEKGLAEDDRENDFSEKIKTDVLATIIQMHKEGKPLPVIAKAVDMPVADLQEILGKLPKPETSPQ